MSVIRHDALDSEQEPLFDDRNDAQEAYPLSPRPTTLNGGTRRLDRPSLMRAIALFCAMFLSVGSHYATYILGPLKSRLTREMGTNNTEFSLLIAALSLNSTWTPLVGGILASKFGTTKTSIMTTSSIFIGQLILLFGDLSQDVRLMALGMFITGLGISPLSVVQESIIVRFFKSHGMGVSIAVGLVAGKGSSFLSAATSYPLTERFGPHSPFYVSTFLTGFSMAVNLFYVYNADRLIAGAGVEPEVYELQVEARNVCWPSSASADALGRAVSKYQVRYEDFKQLGDIFWAYVGLNALAGAIWSPFIHLAANLIEKRYKLTESHASSLASWLLAGSLVLYPIIGYIVDRSQKRLTILKLLLLSSVLTLFCYFWLALPPSLTGTPLPSVLAFFVGYGFSPLLLVLIVPQIVPLKYVPTALGIHKSIEQAASTMFQTLAGWILDTPQGDPGSGSSIQTVVNLFLLINICELAGVLGLRWLIGRHEAASARLIHRPLPGMLSEREGDLEPLTGEDSNYPGNFLEHSEDPIVLAHREHRGKMSVFFCFSFVALTWIFFLVTSFLRLRSKSDRVDSTSE